MDSSTCETYGAICVPQAGLIEEIAHKHRPEHVPKLLLFSMLYRLCDLCKDHKKEAQPIFVLTLEELRSYGNRSFGRRPEFESKESSGDYCDFCRNLIKSGDIARRRELTIDYVRDHLPDKEFSVLDLTTILGCSPAATRSWIVRCRNLDYITEVGNVKGPDKRHVYKTWMKTEYLRSLERSESALP